MLVLMRHRYESVFIGDNIRVRVNKIEHNAVWLGIDAPADVVIDREEIRRAKQRTREGGER